jgi:hypothetical protein
MFGFSAYFIIHVFKYSYLHLFKKIRPPKAVFIFIALPFGRFPIISGQAVPHSLLAKLF